jgi:cytochrome P450
MSAVRSPFTRGPWYAALKLHPERENITSHIDERIHADLRTRMAPGYSGKENLHMENDVDEKLLHMFDLIASKYVAHPEHNIFRTMDLSRLTSFFTLDVISKIAFGQTFGFLDNDDDPFGYLKNLEQFLPAIIVFGVYTELTNIMKMPLIKGALPKTTDKRGLGRVMGFARDRVQERFGPKPIVRQDMLNSFINRGLTQAELESETLTQITAGSDSTASALRITLHFISTSPPILERLLAEVNNGIAAGRVSRPVIQDSEARQMPYLQACVKEGLRIHPPVSGLMAKRVPDGGARIEVDGVEKFAPGGTQIGWNSWGMMHDPEIFGADCEVFRPDRWLHRDASDKEAARIVRMTETVTLNFGSGRFGCLGRGVATMELNKAVVEVSLEFSLTKESPANIFPQTLLRFNLQPCSLAKPFNQKVIGFTVHTDMNFIVTERKTTEQQATEAQSQDGAEYDAGALPGSYDS